MIGISELTFSRKGNSLFIAI